MSTSSINATQFRIDFPEFTDASVYPDGPMNFWIGIAIRMVQSCRYRDMTYHAQALFLAHHLVLQQRDIKAAQVGGIPGDKTGVVSAKAVDKVSVSYDNSSTIDPKAGHWGLTTYGLQFLRLARIAGIGGLQSTGAGIRWPVLGVWGSGGGQS